MLVFQILSQFNNILFIVLTVFRINWVEINIPNSKNNYFFKNFTASDLLGFSVNFWTGYVHIVIN